MAKVRAPLLSVSASGSLGQNLTFSLRKSGQQVRFQKKQKDVITPARQAWRLKYKKCIADWLILSPENKQYYNFKALPYSLTGFNLYIKQHIREVFIVSAVYGSVNYGLPKYGRI